MTVVLTNDDGIDAPGLAALARAVARLLPQEPIAIVAPEVQHSGCGHQVTTQRPIRCTPRAVAGLSHAAIAGEGASAAGSSDRSNRSNRAANTGNSDAPEALDDRDAPDADSPAIANLKAYAIDGTPADCARLALRYLFPEARWLLSGVNAGGNLGADAYISGTVAAAREAAFLGVPAVAVSQYVRRPLEIHWPTVTDWTARLLAELENRGASPPEHSPRATPQVPLWNVNLPHLDPGSAEPELVFCPASRDSLPVDYRIEGDCYVYAGRYDRRPRSPGTDVDACFGGNIAIAALTL